MDIYDTIMKPLEKNGLSILRKSQISKAYGNVLELGAGNGANIPFYNLSKIDSLIITDFNFSKKLDKIKENLNNRKICFKKANVTNLPFENEIFDTILFTLIFCSVLDVSKGLSEIKRTLKKDGQVIFIEHVISPQKPINLIMNTINTPWKKVARGCNLNRDFEKSLIESGFNIIQSHRFYKGIGFSGIAKKLK